MIDSALSPSIGTVLAYVIAALVWILWMVLGVGIWLVGNDMRRMNPNLGSWSAPVYLIAIILWLIGIGIFFW